jgi:putative endonuclease
MFYVYVLHSLEDHGLYIGFSTNLKKRIAKHEYGASFATKYRGPWKLIYYEAYIDRHDAEGRERYVKSRSGRRFLRQQLRQLDRQCSLPLVQPRERRRRFYVATPLGFEPRITPPKGAVLPLHHGVPGSGLDSQISPQAQFPKCIRLMAKISVLPIADP